MLLTTEDIRKSILNIRQTHFEPPVYVISPTSYDKAVKEGYIKDGWFTEKFFESLR